MRPTGRLASSENLQIPIGLLRHHQSDFGFLGIGLYMLQNAVIDSKCPRPPLSPLIRKVPMFAAIGGFVNLVHFFGTLLNHGSRCHFFHRLDVFGMWSVLLFWALYWLSCCASLKGWSVSQVFSP